ncbi:hypothetical protein LXM63_08875 [Chryseobacterium gleum]|uniref:hypothetical protein n=1 Tax=Chryseobacterium gleum TaxID=250 RepID=UPI001E468A53|nr:hypothetical protein [Chryseobacterium gleum]MCE4065209.1 hypothetical protein [Chryseobacterium gleum]
MHRKILFIITILFSACQLLFCQVLNNNCPKNLTYFASSLPIEGNDWYVPIKYDIVDDLIDLKIRHKEKDELFIRFKIIENLSCNFKDAGNCDLKYKILTYNEETNSYEKRQSEIEFKFSNGKGKIYIQHPNFPRIISDSSVIDNAK